MRRFTISLVAGLVVALGGAGVISVVDAAFRPDISRAEAVALVVDAQPQLRTRLQWYIKNMPPMPLYLDANPKAWYGPYLETAFEAGLINGNAQRMFRPRSPITVEEAAALMLKMRGQNSNEVVLYAPSAGSNWAASVLSDARASGLSLPSSLRIGSAISQQDYYTMMSSAGIQSPERIALSINPSQGYLPKPQPVVAVRPVTNTQTTTTTRRIQPITTNTQNTAQRTTPTTTPAATDGFSISMPTLGVNNLTITHPTDPFTSKGLLAPLQQGVGHLFTYPGNAGKILIYGHSSSYPWDVSPYTKIFRQINKLNIGDKVYVNYNGKQHTYEVSFKQAVPANDMSAYQSGGEEELILYTCWPPDSISQRYLVHAKPI